MASPPSRPTPLDLVFSALAEERFPAIRDGQAALGADPRDRDALLMQREVVELLRDLRPDDGVGEGMGHLAALLHHAFLAWRTGAPTLDVPGPTLARALRGEPLAADETGDEPAAYYVQIPERRIWGQPVAGAPHEPLDGWFAHDAGDGALRLLAVFGMHPDRPGLTVVEATGRRPTAPSRPDGTPLFAPVLPGGAAAGLHSVTGDDELLELAWRIRPLARTVSPTAALR